MPLLRYHTWHLPSPLASVVDIVLHKFQLRFFNFLWDERQLAQVTLPLLHQFHSSTMTMLALPVESRVVQQEDDLLYKEFEL